MHLVNLNIEYLIKEKSLLINLLIALDKLMHINNKYLIKTLRNEKFTLH